MKVRTPEKRDVEPEVERAPRQLRPAREAVQHGRERLPRHLLLQDRGDVGVGIAGMDHQRQTRLLRRRDVLAKALGLRLARALVVEVVEPGLADGHDLGVLRQPHDLLHRHVQLGVRVVGVRAHRAEHVGIALGDLQRVGEPPDVRGDRDDMPTPAARARPTTPSRSAAKSGKVEVAVMIDEHAAGFPLPIVLHDGERVGVRGGNCTVASAPHPNPLP